MYDKKVRQDCFLRINLSKTTFTDFPKTRPVQFYQMMFAGITGSQSE